MRVICIKKPIKTNDGSKQPSPEVGDEDVVTEKVIRHNRPFYFLERFGKGLSFCAKCFATADSDLDETELVTEEFEEKYCVPVNQKSCE